MILPVRRPSEMPSAPRLEACTRRARRGARHRHRLPAHARNSVTSPLPVAFELARRLRKAPKVIAEELAARSARSRASRGSKRRRATSTLPRPAAFLIDGWRRRRGAAGGRQPRRIRRTRREDHPSPPPSTQQAAHIGHLRNWRSATRSCESSDSAACRSRSRTTSTTPASRSPTSSSGSATSSAGPGGRPRVADTTRFDFTAGTSTPRRRLVQRRTSGSSPPRDALHDIERGGNEAAENRRLHRRPDRPMPPARRCAA